VSIPNSEIRPVFYQWIRAALNKQISSDQVRPSDTMFHEMISGSMASFARKFRKLVYKKIPSQYFGGKESVFQAFLHAYLDFAATAGVLGPEWNVKMENVGGDGRMELSVMREGEKHGVNLKVEQLRLPSGWEDTQTPTAKSIVKRRGRPQKDGHGPIQEGYGDELRMQLTQVTREALKQNRMRHYRASMPEYVTELREYAVTLQGPFCAIECRAMKRMLGGQWVEKESYSFDIDEENRDRVYY
jgi:hypothetical protein